MTATRRSLLEEVVRAGATYPNVGEPPALMHIAKDRETPEMLAWLKRKREAEKREAALLREARKH